MKKFREPAQYESIYAERHLIFVETVMDEPFFNYAALLEYYVATGVLTLAAARREFVERYPYTNNISRSVCVEDRAGRRQYYDVASVLDMIENVPGATYAPRTVAAFELSQQNHLTNEAM